MRALWKVHSVGWWEQGRTRSKLPATEMNLSQNRFPRGLTDQERTITEWMIDHGTGEKEFYRSQLAQATVVNACDCGCPSIDFAIGGKEPEDRTEREL